MKKLYILSLIFLLWAIPVLGANTCSIDLELSSSQYLSLTAGDSDSLSITGDISIEFWVKLAQLPSDASNQFDFVWFGTFADDIAYFVQVHGVSDKLIMMYDGPAGGFSPTRYITNAAFFDGDDVGNWVHVAITTDVSNTTNGVIMYKDANVVSGSYTSNGATDINNSGGPFHIGANNSGAEEVDGKMDEIRIWSGIRTPTEISDNYQLELVGDEAGLEGYWQFNDESLLDSTDNGNDLTNNNGATFDTDTPFGSGACETPAPAPAEQLEDQFIGWVD